MMDVEFIPVTKENLSAILSLKVAKNQEGFVESIQECLEEAKDYSGWHPVGIKIDHQWVGFSMYCFWKEGDGRVWLDRFLIDHRYQGKGYGRICIPLLIQKLVEEYQCQKIYLSVIKGNRAAEHLYEEFGFRYNGEKDVHGENVMVLELNEVLTKNIMRDIMSML